MKNTFLFIILCFSLPLIGQDYTGVWYNIDDEDGKPKSHILLKKENNAITGTVIKLLPSAKTTVCENCKGDKKNKSLIGMEILWGMKKQSDGSYSGGEILNPKNGKVYSCNMRLTDNNTLEVRGYLGLSIVGKTQLWKRVDLK